ncbi:hypothetical protein BCR42DRAFT_416901 [Absidia repens]|uniref:FAD-binding FR-type domain-containing protein n=1 Tax=Absidia repens TaxID=90262 RepID=A0A1X2IF48_9FUNG|nr:hypothetical protein BCR42DRAFT_416901 [Absidia repens]
MWYSVQWVFSSSYTDTMAPATVPSSSSSTPSTALPSTPITATVDPNDTIPPPSKPVRYERDYTTLVGYPISFLIIYSIYFIFIRYRRFFPDVAIPVATTTTPSPMSSNSSNGYTQQEEGSKQLDQQQPPPSMDINKRQHSTIYLILRRWWHYEFRCFDNTFRLGTYMTLLALSGLHSLFIFWPFFWGNNNAAAADTNPFFRHQLISNRIAQLAVVDMAVVVGLSVHTSILWRLIGLHNSSMTLPWHRWFARFSVFGVVYHGCFQWTKHYYRHHLAEPLHQLDALLLGNAKDIDVADFDQSGMLLSSVTWWDLLVSNPRYLTGTCMVLCLLVLFLGSHPLVREKWYGVFRATHVVSFLSVVVMGMWHHWAFVVFYVAVIGVWLVDIIARWRSMRVAPVVTLEVVADQVIKLQVVLEPPRRSSCRCRQPSQHSRQTRELPLLPGQYVFCSFSGTKWKDLLWSHPFSISRVDSLENSPTESSEKRMLTFFIKVYGKQTKALYNKANIKENWPTVRLGSPLGHAANNCHWTDIYGLYPVVVLVAEGIGITPWMSVLHSLIMMNSINGNGRTTVKHLNIIWTVRDGNMIKPFINDIEEMMSTATTATNSNENGDNGSAFHIDWHIYVTGSTASHLDEEQQSGMASSTTMGSNTSQRHDRNCHYQYHQGRPNYTSLLESIRLKHDDKDVALGICAHEESATVCGNLARSARFSHANAYWNVRLERFDL